MTSPTIDLDARPHPVATFRLGDFVVGDPAAPPVALAGVCVIESRDHTLRIAETLVATCARVGIGLVFKASFDKANRSALGSYRGPGMEAGLAILAEVRAAFGVPVVTDVHEPAQCAPVAEAVDLLQIPAFLARQTDLLVAAGRTGRPVNVKKAQYMAPEDMANVASKLADSGAAGVMLTDRGTFFGYRQLVNDFRGLPVMRALGRPVCFDATHSVQSMGGMGTASGGAPQFIPTLARAAAAVGIDALFLETHDAPERALSDGPNALPLPLVEPLLRRIVAIDAAARER